MKFDPTYEALQTHRPLLINTMFQRIHNVPKDYQAAVVLMENIVACKNEILHQDNMPIAQKIVIEQSPKDLAKALEGLFIKIDGNGNVIS